eukprot:PhF_6_TR27910/c0_g1_i3/m.40972
MAPPPLAALCTASHSRPNPLAKAQRPSRYPTNLVNVIYTNTARSCPRIARTTNAESWDGTHPTRIAHKTRKQSSNFNLPWTQRQVGFRVNVRWMTWHRNTPSVTTIPKHVWWYTTGKSPASLPPLCYPGRQRLDVMMSVTMVSTWHHQTRSVQIAVVVPTRLLVMYTVTLGS